MSKPIGLHILTFLLISWVTMARSQSGGCPNGNWLSITDASNYCYHFSNQKANFSRSMDICESMNGTLVMNIENEQTNKALIKNSRKRRIEYFYLGTKLSFFDLEWADKTPINFTKWEEGHPQPPQATACTFLQAPSGTWTTDTCSSWSHNVVCQKEKVMNNSTGTLECPPAGGDWWVDVLSSSNYCYHFSEERGSEFFANLTCTDLEGSLVGNIYSEDLNSAIAEEANRREMNLGIFLGTRSNEPIWLDDTPMTYSKWSDYSPLTRNCTEMYVPRPSGWTSHNCYYPNRVVCQIEKIAV